MKTVYFTIALSFIFLVGCEAARQGAQEVGKPVGGVSKVVGGVTEGAADAYGDYEGDNPFHR